MVPFYRLMLITQKKEIPLNKYLDFIKKSADGGITSLQLRDKDLSFAELVDFGNHLLEIIQPYNIPLIINDSPLLAKEISSSYIHIGQEDETVENIYEILNHNANIGISLNSQENLFYANQYPNIAYVTASAVFPTKNKLNTTIWGLEGIQQLARISLPPLTAIGGITLENVSDVITYGAQGVAVIGAIHDSDNPFQTTKQLRVLIDEALSRKADNGY